MTDSYMGGCACGAIRFDIADEPIFQNHCQCHDCQYMTSAGHASYLTFRRQHVKQFGQATLWQMTGDSGNAKSSGFCPTCGTPVYLTFAAMPDIFTVHAASLDDPSRFKPQVLTYAKRGRAWDLVDPTVPAFAAGASG